MASLNVQRRPSLGAGASGAMSSVAVSSHDFVTAAVSITQNEKSAVQLSLLLRHVFDFSLDSKALQSDQQNWHSYEKQKALSLVLAP